MRRSLRRRATGPFDTGLGFGFALLAWTLGFGAMLPALRDEVSMSLSVAAIHGSLFGIFLLLFSVLGSHFFATRSNRLTLGVSFAGMLIGRLAVASGFSWRISCLVPIAIMAVGRLSLSNLLRRFAPQRILACCFSGAIVACAPFLLGRAAALGSGVGVAFGPLLLGACSDVVGLGWATAILPAFLTAGLLTVLRPLPATRSLAA